MKPELVLDTTVITAALLSRRGASYQLLRMVGTGLFNLHISVPLVLEYEATTKRLVGNGIDLTDAQVDDVIDYLCLVGQPHQIRYLWRPFLSDAEDDMLLELAVAAGAAYIVTFNVRDFKGTEQFDVKAITPGEMLRLLEG